MVFGSTVVDFSVDFIVSVVVPVETDMVVFFIAVDSIGCVGVVTTLDVLLDSVKDIFLSYTV